VSQDRVVDDQQNLRPSPYVVPSRSDDRLPDNRMIWQTAVSSASSWRSDLQGSSPAIGVLRVPHTITEEFCHGR